MKFRKKPVEIEAVQITEQMAREYVFGGIKKLPDGARFSSASSNTETGELNSFFCVIETMEGDMRATIGDWIITGVKGEKYPCKPDIFEQTYEAV